MPKGITAKAQKEGESHVRYKKAVEKVISLATSEQEKASLRMMVVQEFLVERDESGTVSFKPRFPFTLNASSYF